MLVAIAGAGNVGKYLIESFLEVHENIILIESDEKVIENIKSNFDILVIKGSMLSHYVLQKANIKNCELFIACSNSDSRNILACQLAKRLGAHHTVARIYSDQICPQQYGNDEINELEKYLGIDAIVSPNRIAGFKLAYAIFDNEDFSLDSYFHGHLDVVNISVSKNNFLLGKKISKTFASSEASIISVIRENQEIEITKEDKFLVGDEVILAGKHTKIISLILEIYSSIHKQTNHIYLAGISRTAATIFSLFKERIKNITFLDKDLEVCKKIDEKYNIKVLNIDPADFKKLNSLKLHNEGVFVCSSENDNENLSYFFNARELGFSQVIILVNQYQKMRLVKQIQPNENEIMSLPYLAAQEIFRFFNQYIKKDFILVKGSKARAINKEIDNDSTWIGKSCQEILNSFPSLKFVCLWRDGIVHFKEDKETEEIVKDDRIIFSSLEADHSELQKILNEN